MGQGALEQQIEAGRALGHTLAEGARWAGEQGGHHLAEGVGLVGPHAGDHLVEHDAHRPEIGAVIDLAGVAQLLGRHVHQRAQHGPGGGRPLVGRVALAHHLGDAEVEELHRPARLAEEDVVGLEIAVDQAHGVGRGEGVEDVEEHGADGLEGQRLAGHAGLERLALEQLHHQVEVALGRAPRVGDADDAGVTYRCGSPGLGEEARGQAVLQAEARVEQLHRRGDAGEGVAGAEDHAHAALAEERVDRVAAVDDLSLPVRHGRADCTPSRRLTGLGGAARCAKPGPP